MTPQQLVQIKITLSECYCTEVDFVVFLMDCLDKYSSGLPSDETFKAKWFSDRIYALLDKIKVQLDRPPDKLPVYLQGGYPQTFIHPRAGTMTMAATDQVHRSGLSSILP